MASYSASSALVARAGELAQPDDFRNSGPFSPWPFSSRFAARWSTSPEKKFVKLGRDSLLRPLSRTGGELVALSWGPGLFFDDLGTRLRFFGDGWVPNFTVKSVFPSHSGELHTGDRARRDRVKRARAHRGGRARVQVRMIP